jgi:hypothetical protein
MKEPEKYVGIQVIKCVSFVAFIIPPFPPLSISFALVLTSSEIPQTELIVFVVYLRAPKLYTRSDMSVFRHPQEFIKFSV